MYCAYIVELKSLREHSNADRLLCTEVFGNNIIVSKDYYEGQKCIFFPTDGKIGLEFAEKNNLVRKKDENGNNIGGYLDPDKRNVTALKLRGEKSEGLLLPIESLQDFTDINDLKVGDTITVLNGITICEKYIPRRNQRSNSNYNSNKKKNKKESKEKVSYPFFEEHVDTAQLAYNMNAFKPGDTIYLTRKLHGCFTSQTRIRLWNQQRAVKISKIQIGDTVVGYKDGKFVPTKVQNVFINGKTNEWQKIKYSRNDLLGEPYGKIQCTPDHLFWDIKTNNYKPAKELNKGEKIGLVKEDWILDNISKSILLGMYLGDSYYSNKDNQHNGVTATLQFGYKIDHFEYLKYIKKTMSDFVIIDNNIYTSGYRTKTRRGHTRYSIDLRNYFDSILDTTDSDNKLTEKIIDYFTIETLTFLYLDDGSLGHNDSQQDRANIAICDYNEHDSKIIIKCLNNLGFDNVTYYKDPNGYSRIRLNADSADKMFNMIKDYVPEVMKYKLPEKYRNSDVKTYKCDIQKGYNFITCEIIENEKYFSRNGQKKYDLQTETSNYVVGNLLVHNSSGRTANSIKTTRKSPNIIKKILHIKPKIKEEWELISGTRRTVLKDYDGGYYGTNQFRRQYHDFFKDKLPKGFEVFYEIVGYIDGTETPIMGKCSNKLVKDKAFEKMYGKETVFNYGCEVGHSDFYVYRITHTSNDGVITEVPWEVVKIWCERWGCKHVPELEKFLYTTWEDLNNRVNQYLDQPEPLANGSHVCEGVVARIDNREKFTAYKQKGFFFKCLEGIIKDNSDAPDMEEAEELIAEEQQELVE